MKDKDVQSAMYEVYLRELAFWTCVNKIATVSYTHLRAHET